jgi:hypothetical protein
MSLQTKIIIAQTIALAVVMPIVAFAMHGIELSCRAIWKRIAASRITSGTNDDSTRDVQHQPASMPLVRGRRENKKSRRRRNRLLKAEMNHSPKSKP